MGSLLKRIKTAFIGEPKNPKDRSVFHQMSLIAFFAWVGLGADGLSSSCYGPEEAFLALGNHPHLSIFIAAASAVTVFLISSSYAQIIELFPTGGGGYLVASKLLSPNVGMVAGCALIVDYVLTITISIASGADAIFSLLPREWVDLKLYAAVLGVIILSVMNLRGVKESVKVLTPIFLVFVFTHLFVIGYTIFINSGNFAGEMATVKDELSRTHVELGTWGMFFLLMKAYSLGAGTYTGIETVSNGIPTLREPKVQTGKRTMLYMSISLSVTVVGLILGYLFLKVQPVEGKTLNAVLFETIAKDWGRGGEIFVLVTLFSEAMLLFVAAQAGFIGGPRVLSNMALDRWFPSKFTYLSDRLVAQNGILLMAIAALAAMILTKGSVKLLVVLYSINVFVTFCLSQAGMVRHWWLSRGKGWIKKIIINGTGLALCTFILLSVIILKFFDGGWITIFITGLLIIMAIFVKRHYEETMVQLKRLDELVTAADIGQKEYKSQGRAFDPESKTAVLLVNGYNGLGLHTLFNVIRLFGKEFKNFVFVEIGVINAGNFKGTEEIENLTRKIEEDVAQYVAFMNSQGYYAKGLCYVGLEVMEEVEARSAEILAQYPNAVFFGGQLVFSKETIMKQLFHNFTVFALQRMFYHKGIPFVILPIRVP